jgi:acyl carrier protein
LKVLHQKLSEILEVPEVKPDDVLKEFEAWDSLAVLSIIAMLGNQYGIRISAMELNTLHTVADLEALVSQRKTK